MWTHHEILPKDLNFQFSSSLKSDKQAALGPHSHAAATPVRQGILFYFIHLCIIQSFKLQILLHIALYHKSLINGQ